MILSIHNERERVGTLSTSKSGICFSYDQAYVEAGGFPLSLSMPLREEAFPERIALPFFDGFLPEGEQRRELSNLLHISSTSTMKLLGALAGECVGNLIVLEDGMSVEAMRQHDGYVPLDEAELEELLRPRSALRTRFIAQRRLSLAGAQAKIGLYREGDRWFATTGLFPTTHIIKPVSLFDPSLLANEFFTMRLAHACGLQVPAVDILRCGESHGLVLERFDRRLSKAGIMRIGQEDFCQALSVMPASKYENDGGPGYAAVFETTTRHTSPPLPSLRMLLKTVVFNFLIGNCDAHAKNFSLLRDQTTGALSLAPAYDLLSTTYYGNRLLRSMAMSLGRHSVIDRVDDEDFALFAKETGVSLAAVTNEFAELRTVLAKTLHSIPGQLIDEAPLFAHDFHDLREHLLRELEVRRHILAG
ncbi:MAG: HipA domain-containing protein [Coriobacteriales bacterium]|jgi:serine/threonine-protein kinase HipA|nr:HipA domain-containing protein [Coriobacteriales bacterium]